MLKPNKKPIINKLKQHNRITDKQAKIAYIIQHMEYMDSKQGSRTDSSCKILVDASPAAYGLENSMQDISYIKKFRETKELWEHNIKEGHIDPLALQITKYILHYNISPADIAREFTEQLHQKSGGQLLKRFNVRITSHKIEKMFKQAIDLFIKIGDY
ncbi:MAG: hypothetical protein ACK5MJ_08825 [Alphaproteobacteria bacterium]